MTSFVISGKPFAWKRPRFNRASGATFNDATQEAYFSTVASIAQRHTNGPIDGPVSLGIAVTFAMPKSWSNKKRAAMAGQLHTQKPDLSNLVKAIEDACNRVLFRDDAQVAVYAECSKRWGDTDETIVTVEAR